jgi:hypothetical protein
MSTEYVGIPTAARAYLGSYVRSVVALGIVISVTGALGALLVGFFSPTYMVFYTLAVGSVILHISAIYVRDVWDGSYDPGQTKFASGGQLLAVIALIGITNSAVFLLGTAIAAGAAWLGASFLTAAVLAAYYPVIDIVLLRHGYWTPGFIIAFVTARVIVATLHVPTSLFDSLPVIGARRPPQA